MFALANEAKQVKGRSMSRLHVDSLSVSYDSFSLQNVAFDIMPGEIIALVGKNGAGTMMLSSGIIAAILAVSGAAFALSYIVSIKFYKMAK